MAKEVSAKQEQQAGYSLDEVRELAQIVQDFDLSGLELERGGEKISLSRQLSLASQVAPVQPALAAATAVASRAAEQDSEADDGSVVVSSPFVGTFYRAPSPDSPPFVEPGQVIHKGQVLCIVEAMKLMNEIEAEVEGEIIQIVAQNGEAVEYGQPLFRVFPVA